MSFRLEEAAAILDFAKLCLSEGDTNGAANRAYFSMLNTAIAVTTELNPSVHLVPLATHEKVMEAFTQEIRVPGYTASEFEALMSEIHELRKIADVISGEDVRLDQATFAVESANDFYNWAEYLINDLNAPEDGPSPS